MGVLTKSQLNDLFDYFKDKGWSIKNHNSLIIEWEDKDFGLTNWCDDSWTEGYSKRCYRDTPSANDILKIMGWDRKIVRFLKKEEKNEV